MTSQASTLTAFTDAAADRVARLIAETQRENQRERELRDAEFRARIAELETRLAAVSEAERRLDARIASIKDGEPGKSVTIEELNPVIAEGIERAVAAFPIPKDGEPGKNLTVDDVKPVLEELVRAAVESIPPPEPGKSITIEDVEPMISERINAAVSAIPPVEPKEVDPEAITRAVAEAVALIPQATAGKDADMSVVEARIAEFVESAQAAISEAIRSIPTPENGKDGVGIFDASIKNDWNLAITLTDGREIDVGRVVGWDGVDIDIEKVQEQIAETIRQLWDEFPKPKDGESVDMSVVEEMIARAVAAFPVPQNGRDADPELVASLVNEKVAEAVALIPPAERGEQGPMGRLPTVRNWEDRVHYESEVVSFEGGVFQAMRDTGKPPLHEDWNCIVRAGTDGAPGRSFVVRGTWNEADEYGELDVVALNGAAFVARRDNPGACPGDGWQMISSQGKPGKPGIPGPKGDRGIAVTAAITRMVVSDEGMLAVTSADGSVVKCDLYPLLSKLN